MQRDMYRITKFCFDEKQGITALEIQDMSGNTISPLISQNLSSSDTNESGLIELPEITEKNFVFSGETKTQKKEKKSNIDILRDFCKERIQAEPEWKEDILKFGKTYSELDFFIMYIFFLL